jgi:hypothetical protein
MRNPVVQSVFQFAASPAECHELIERATAAIILEFARFAGQRKQAIEEAGRQVAKKERERAELAAKIENDERLRQWLEQKRRNAPWRPPIPDWRPDHKAISLPGSRFGMEALVARIKIHVSRLACDYMSYERSVITGVAIEQREAHAIRARQSITAMIFPPVRGLPPLQHAKGRQRLIPLPLGGFYVIVDQDNRVRGLQASEQAERESEPPSLTNLWGFQHFPHQRRQLKHDCNRLASQRLSPLLGLEGPTR